MKIQLFLGIFLCCLCATLSAKTSDIHIQRYLHGRVEPTDKRYASFSLALTLIQERDAKILVETGTARYGNYNFVNFVQDGGSTIIFSDWAFNHSGSRFYTVDISAEYIATAKAACIYHQKNTKFVCSDSLKFLNNFHTKIDFLYLDSYDFDELNPNPSQEFHLKEIKAAYPKLHKNSIIMIDDCDLPHGGKGKLVIPFLQSKGWKILYKGYQTILVR